MNISESAVVAHFLDLGGKRTYFAIYYLELIFSTGTVYKNGHIFYDNNSVIVKFGKDLTLFLDILRQTFDSKYILKEKKAPFIQQFSNLMIVVNTAAKKDEFF